MNERHLGIIELLNSRDRLHVADASAILDVSTVTIRKDFALLEQEGLLRRQHGYAVRVLENDISYRMTFEYEIKLKIAQAAVQLVDNSETIMIESGSSCAILANEIAEKKRDVTIITNSSYIANYIRNFQGTKVILLGGLYDSEAQVVTGPLVKLCAEKFFVDKFFIGTDGFDLVQGFSNVDLARAEAARAMAQSAKNKIILTESSKFNKRGVVSLFKANEVDMVITNSVPANCRENLQERGVTIKIAK